MSGAPRGAARYWKVLEEPAREAGSEVVGGAEGKPVQNSECRMAGRGRNIARSAITDLCTALPIKGK